MNDSEFIAHFRNSDRIAQLLILHLFGAAELGKNNAAKIGLARLGELLALLHDIGKYSLFFQTYIKSAVGLLHQGDLDHVDYVKLKGKIDHATAGAQYLWEKWHERGKIGLLAGEIMALCLASHHSGLIDCLELDGNDNFSKRMKKQLDQTHLGEVLVNLEDKVKKRIDEIIASDEAFSELQTCFKRLGVANRFPVCRDFQVGLVVRFLFSCLVDADRTDTADFESSESVVQRKQIKYPDWSWFIQKLECRIAQFENRNPIDKIRGRISQQCRDFANQGTGCWRLTVPTGGGKTLASFRFALYHVQKNKLKRIIYVLPFTTIIDQNAAELRKVLQNNEYDPDMLVLEHHSNLVPDKDNWQHQALTETWDAPIIFTTSVQLLETLFAGGTRGARRMHQLAHAVIIFDEIQALPLNVIHMFNNAVNFLVEQCGSTVVLCTATQPLLDKVSPDKGALRFSTNAEMMPDVNKLFEGLHRVNAMDCRKNGGWADKETAAKAIRELQTGNSVLVIANTKKIVKTVYQECKSASADSKAVKVFHLSTNMYPAHRKKILAEIQERLESKQKTLVISSSLIEAGIDIDLDCVIRYLAGLPSIAQAAGRCNRNGKIPTGGRVLIINTDKENLSSLPDIQIGKDVTQRILDEYKTNPELFDHDLLGLKAMAKYYQYYFAKRSEEMNYGIAKEKIGAKDDLLNLLSCNSTAVEAYKNINKASPPIFLRQAFMTAGDNFKVIEAPNEGVIVQDSEESKKIIGLLCSDSPTFEDRRKLMKQAQQYSVNLFPQDRDKLFAENALHDTGHDDGVLWLDEQHYQEDFGVSIEDIGTFKLNQI